MFCVPAEGLFRVLGIEGRKHGGESKLGGEAVTAHPRYDPDTGVTADLGRCTQILLDGPQTDL